MPKAGYVLNLKPPDFGFYLCFTFNIFSVMLKSILIGNLGADAEVRSANGREFVSFRVAHSWNFTAQDGTVNSGTIWVDCIGSNLKDVVEYLKKGTQVFVEGNVSLRVYSSKVDRCMKAGLTINVETLQLIGSKPDLVPKQVINPDDGSVHAVTRKYMVTDMHGVVAPDAYKDMVDEHGNLYSLDTLGFIQPQSTNTTN